MRGQRSTKFVGDGIEKGGTQAFAFARRFDVASSPPHGRARRDGDQAADGLQRLAGKISRHAEAPTVLTPIWSGM